MMNIIDYLKDNFLYLDGGTGTLLQAKGLRLGELPEMWNITHPELVSSIHKEYFDVGSNVVCTNTFGANLLHYEKDDLRKIIFAAIDNVRTAIDASNSKQEKFIALDIGPLGMMMKPYGDLPFEDAVAIFAEIVKIGADYTDLILIETMNDSYETKAALLAAKENSSLPVFVSNAYSEDGKLVTGTTPMAMIALLEGMGADAIGVNCSLGPKQLSKVVDEYLRYSSLPLIVKPNAGIPILDENGQTKFNVEPDEFADDIVQFVRKGVRIIGGCCGTTPSYIEKIHEKTKDIPPLPVEEKNITMVSSGTHAVVFGNNPILIGERINPTGKKMFKEALKTHDINYILNEGIKQQEAGVHILDVNVGIPDIDESELLREVVLELQAVSNLPLQIDTSDICAMENALRIYNGKPMINSVNGKMEVMDSIFPLVKKYGGVVVCLTLDYEGIPETSTGRIELAKKIIHKATEYNISKKNLIFDPLSMAISASKIGANPTLEAIDFIRKTMECHTILGVSNISFGLPERDILNSIFFAIALERGLSAAIMNPLSNAMMRCFYAFKALHGLDESCITYIQHIEKYRQIDQIPKLLSADAQHAHDEKKSDLSGIKHAIIKGLKLEATKFAEEMLQTFDPLTIVSEYIIPALDIVGEGFEKKTIYLPQLLMSAEAAQSAFIPIKLQMEKSRTTEFSRGKFVIATVKGDIHDIGKNIVKLVLENYGFAVFDMGKDVSPDDISKKVVEIHADFVGLSALMTTTLPSMAETIKILRKVAHFVKIIVGGAVLTQEYADYVGADFYAKDVMATVNYAIENVKGNQKDKSI